MRTPNQLKVLCMLLALGMALSCTKKTEPQGPVGGAETQELMNVLSGGVDPAQWMEKQKSALATLERMEPSADENQKKWISKARDLLKTPPASDFGALQSTLNRYRELLEELPGVYPKEVYLRASALKSLYYLAYTEENATPKLKKIREAAEKLKAEYPEVEEVYYLSGFLATDLESVLASFKKCLQINPKHEECRKHYDNSADAYRQPTCREIRRLTLTGAHEPSAVDQGKRTVEMEGQKLTLEAEPIFTQADMEKLVSVKDAHSEDTIAIHLKAQATEKLAKETERLTGSWIVIELDGKAVSAPKVVGKIEMPVMHMVAGSGNKFRFEDYCVKVETPTLPPELAL